MNTKNEGRGGVQVVDMGIDNFARQSRHSLSRLVGSSAGLAGVDPRDLIHQMTQAHQMADTSTHPTHSHSHSHSHSHRDRERTNTKNNSNLPYSSQPHNGSGSGSGSGLILRSAKIDGNVVTVVEPSTPSPAPHQMKMNMNNMNFGQKDFTPTFSHFGRSSAPPQIFDGSNDASHMFSSNSATSAALRQHTATSLQRRAAELRGLQNNMSNVQKKAEAVTAVTTAQSSSHTPVPSFSNAPSSSRYSVNHTHTHTQNHNHNNHNNHLHHRPPTTSPLPPDQETETQHELRSFIWSANNSNRSNHSHGNFSSNNNSRNHGPSRALAIFGASQLPISEVRSTCEAFGSLLYFRSEFCSSKNVIFVAYHDLRSACHASKELKTYLQRITSSNLNEIESITCRDALKVLYSVSLTASSERNDSALLFSNVPYGIDKETFTQMMTSFGAVQSVDQQNLNSEDSSILCFGVSFYDVQDASHCILEMQSTMPWGPSVSIKAQMRAENERKRGQDFLSLISNWRLGTRATPVPSMQNNIPKNIATESRLSSTSSPSSSSLSPKIPSDENLRQMNNPSTASTESTTPPIAFAPQAPQLVVGPDGQYSYVIVQPHAYQASSSQYAQPAAVLPSPIAPPHQAHSIPAPHYVFDGQNYWLQSPAREQHQHQHAIPNTHTHVPTYHQVSNPSVATYPVMPVYPMANPGGQAAQTDSSLSSGSSHNYQNHNHQNLQNHQNHQNHAYAANIPLTEVKKENNDKADSSNQRNHLDLEAVKKGWDIRTSLMIRNIPNK